MDRVIVSTKGNNKGMYIKLAVVLLLLIPVGSWFIGIFLSKSFVEVTQRCVRGIAVSDKKVNPLTPQSTVLPKPSSAWASTK